MTTITSTSVWDERADRAQDSLDYFFGTSSPQLYNNAYPLEPGDNDTFNYWWLAHLIDARLDAYDRSGETSRLEQAEAVYRNIRERNGGTLFNDYFDDMLWYALAILRLYDRTGSHQYLADAIALWDHVIEHGWNHEQGTSLAWRKQQLNYKNTPANGPLIILGCRLSSRDERHDHPDYLGHARTAFYWLRTNLVDPTTGFVEDGINREGDGRVDTHWRFTYNQGLFIGAAIEMSRAGDDPGLIEVATKTALTAIRELAPDGVFGEEGDGGDEGLFKGIYYRYTALLLNELRSNSAAYAQLHSFITASTDALWRLAPAEGDFLAGNDWAQLATGKIRYSTQLSAMMATEMRAQLDRQV